MSYVAESNYLHKLINKYEQNYGKETAIGFIVHKKQYLFNESNVQTAENL